MKTLVAYSSRTGNTKKVAEAIYEVMPEDAEIASVEDVKCLDKYDFIAIGCWIDKGTADKKALEFIEKVKNKNVAIFITLGAYPDSQHARESMDRIKKLLEKENNIVGEFICQGKIDPKLIEKFKSLPPDHPHALNPERIKRHKEAAKHPNEEDFKKAKKIFKNIIENLESTVCSQ
ncbi:flavodoxin family protein [Caloranaerobacter azorensis]|uniref:Flavodoxin n=1 Tax=Caloranaerobacter azorensis TaxID=116090 RepID=A0A6P1YEX2_9FIRM|nr:flavodoxin family protein [Caloranaerobacter azorensis]QIB27830.1 flavodoxin [Caloranaerobacter azorensis]